MEIPNSAVFGISTFSVGVRIDLGCFPALYTHIEREKHDDRPRIDR